MRDLVAALAMAISLSATPAGAQSPGPRRRAFVPCVERDRSPADSDTGTEAAKQETAQATKQAAALTAWIDAQTHWTRQELPRIRIVAQADIQKMFDAAGPGGFKCEALYSKMDDTVYLAQGWRPHELRDRSILLHELVHHLQDLNQVKAACESELEFQAFKLQAAWLSEQGVTYPLDLIGVSLRYVMMLSHCPEF